MNARLYWWLLECTHYGTSDNAGGDGDPEMPVIVCKVCVRRRRGVQRLPGFAQFGD